MPTPKKGYFLKDGGRVPGTTTVIGRFKESAGLMQWAFKQGKEGKDRLYEEAEAAADIGTCVHAMVELHTSRGTEEECRAFADDTLSDPALRAKAISGFMAYLAWAKNFDVKIIEKEIQLVSEQYKYGGTPDAIGLIGNQLVLIDYKTSNGIYTDYLVQLAAYEHLWNENFPDKPITGGSHLLRFSKENEDFAHHHYPDLSNGWRQFVLFREAYELDKSLKKRAA